MLNESENVIENFNSKIDQAEEKNQSAYTDQKEDKRIKRNEECLRELEGKMLKGIVQSERNAKEQEEYQKQQAQWQE